MLTLELPDHVSEAQARLALAVGLFQEELVSVGKAASIAGLSYRTFLDVLHQKGIPAYVYDDEMLNEDLAFARAFKAARGL